MHLPTGYLEITALICAVAGFCLAWLTRWHVLLAAAAGTGVLFLAQCALQLFSENTASLFGANGPMMFYAIISLWGMIPAFAGAGLARLIERWRHK